ncbi:AAA family ATPase [Aquisalibacillus elongatus]|uniref:Putative AbiEii toxin of type IV toxin-antitoxin system n=1 Tax=Aquisalibacillus elongatus TaxID=485577 RepID=A0A3N5BJ08_9BACI|nr:AAA family ATPase [Aquisalibacillus elongatus]RPF55260.1 putative AbiEii toxin of type IV toxin-antitoxin system [Aquisalibacillus elongatus]
MKLLYFWFDKYKDMNNFEANLGSEFSFHFNGKELICEDNKIYLNNFFELPVKKSNTNNTTNLNISAIVGENGSGKSTLLDFLSDIMSKKHIESKHILIYSINNKIHILHSPQVKFSIKNNSSDSITFCISPLILNSHLTLLFSNVFDVRSIGMLKEEGEIYYSNISTNYLIGKHANISGFLRSEFEKQIFFVNDFSEELNIQNIMKIPREIYIEVSIDLENVTFTDDLEDVIRFLEDGPSITDFFTFLDSEQFYIEFYSGCLKAFFIHIDLLLSENNLTEAFEYDFRDYLYRYSSDDKSIFDSLYKQFEFDIPNLKNNVDKEFLKQLFTLKENFNTFFECVENINLYCNNKGTYILTESPQTKEFISLYRKALTKTGFLKFTWSDMSSGEYGLLNLFSRFYDILDNLKKDELLLSESDDFDTEVEIIYKENQLQFEEKDYSFPKSFILLIDEGDLYFHPQWQKDWLYYFIKLTNLLFNGDVQIILTTHSPFVLSDFPNSNVIFLENKNNINESYSFLDNGPKTFASNIIELFSNSFFIKDGLIGSFAKEKINLFIRQLLQLSPQEVYHEKDTIKKFIDTIGEPLLKNKILEIYNNKLELHDNHELDNRITTLENELSKLKKQRKM